ncbi:MAG: PAS domain S-box protein [Chloroflexota bacterium]
MDSGSDNRNGNHGVRQPGSATMLPADEHILRATWDFAADAMVVSDRDGVVIAANPAYCELYGYSHEEVVGKSFAIIFPEDDRAQAVELYKETFASPEIAPTVESSILRKDGSTGVVEVSYSFIVENGQRTAMFSQIRDVSQRKQTQRALEAERLRSATIIEAAAEGVYGIDSDGNCTFINPAALEFLGYTASECLGRNKHNLIHYKYPDGSPYPAEQCPICNVLRDGVTRRLVEVTLWHKDGSPLPALCSCAPKIVDGRVVGAIITMVDISERKKAEEERVRLLAIAEEARAVAEQALRAQEEMLLVVSHDLRSPTTVIKGMSQLLQMRIARGIMLDPVQLTSDLTKLIDAANRIDNFLQDLTNGPHIQRGQSFSITPQHVDLVALARNVVASHQPRTDRHKLMIEAQSPELFGYWDPARLEQVLDNLISNAVKYSPQGGVVKISIGYEKGSFTQETDEASDGQTEGGVAVLTVEDEGMGIPADDLPHVFELYRRGANVRGVIGGTGVGLAGAQQLVEQHGGRITVASQEGVGSTFTVLLPRGSSNADAQQEP